jgi:mono/diheme cytochrome c family protein
VEWFPQMKEQLAVQPFEELRYDVRDEERKEGLLPPDGAVAIAEETPDPATLELAEQEALQNPVPATLASLKRGEEIYRRTCRTCHGPGGEGNGTVAGPPFGEGPFGLVLPIGGPSSLAKALTDGHIYTTISLGRGRMPSYQRIDPRDRWNVINFLRDLNGQSQRVAQNGGRP